MIERIFAGDQRIMQLPDEESNNLHERLREIARNSFVTVREETRIITNSWYTYAAGVVLAGIPNAVAVCTSTCKHELPYKVFVGRRGKDWQKKLGDGFVYELCDLGRELTEEERDAIYDNM